MEQVITSLNSTFLWPQTDYGETAHIQCPCDAFPELTKDAFASRTCGAGGQWMKANVAACVFDNRDTYCKVRTQLLGELHKQVEIRVACTRSLFLQDGINVLVSCDGVAASLSGSEVTMLTNAWAELLTQAAIDDERVSKTAYMQLRSHHIFCPCCSA